MRVVQLPIVKQEARTGSLRCLQVVYQTLNSYLAAKCDNTRPDPTVFLADGREIDFCVIKDLKPQMFIECKWAESSTSPHLHYLQKKFPEAEYYQVSATGSKRYINRHSITHLPAIAFLQQLV